MLKGRGSDGGRSRCKTFVAARLNLHAFFKAKKALRVGGDDELWIRDNFVGDTLEFSWL